MRIPSNKHSRVLDNAIFSFSFDIAPEDHDLFLNTIRRIDSSLKEETAEKLWLELSRTSEGLSAWLKRSSMNAKLFEQNPLKALAVAPIGFDKQLLDEFRRLTEKLSDKLKEGERL